MYLTPPGAQAYAIHFDWMESFIIQIEGMKEWHLFNTLISLPRKYQSSTPDIEKDVDFNTIQRLTMYPGSMMYIPSG